MPSPSCLPLTLTCLRAMFLAWQISPEAPNYYGEGYFEAREWIKNHPLTSEMY